MDNQIDLTKLSTEELVGIQMDLEKQQHESAQGLRIVRNVLAIRVDEARKARMDKKVDPPFATPEQVNPPVTNAVADVLKMREAAENFKPS